MFVADGETAAEGEQEAAEEQEVEQEAPAAPEPAAEGTSHVCCAYPNNPTNK